MVNKFNLMICLILSLLYGCIVFVAFSPSVSEEYRAYYIDRTITDWKFPQYQATEEEGIDFYRLGWPNFIRFTAGISYREAWGRWADARLAPNAKPSVPNLR
jgi:hypothetical protein